MTDSYLEPQPALLVSASRSGSTMLMHSLDSHPQIACERYEPLNPDSPWMSRLNGNREGVIRALWERPGYRVAMFKMTYRHFRWAGKSLLKEYKPVIIHLYRENALRCIVSSAYNTALGRGEIDYVSHSFVPISTIPKITLSLKKLWVELDKYEQAVKDMLDGLSKLKLPTVYLTYEQLTNNRQVNRLDSEVTNIICSMLRIDEFPMTNQLAKLNTWPLVQVIENWNEVREEFSNTHYAKYLTEEERVTCFE
jgi:hypothetical protein